MDFNAFMARWEGKCLDWDGVYGCQCVDLANAWAHELGHPLPLVGAAADFWDQTAISGYDKIANTPYGVPQSGDIVIWGRNGVGPYGHVALFVTGDPNTFTSFDQNWPIASVCHKQWHDYAGVVGWFHHQTGCPTAVKVLTFSPAIQGQVVSSGSNWCEPVSGAAVVGQRVAGGTAVSYEEAVLFSDGRWLDRISPRLALWDVDVDTGGTNPQQEWDKEHAGPVTDFSGTIVPAGAHVREYPGTDAPVVQQPGQASDVVIGGTQLTFTAWCEHEPRGGTDEGLYDSAFTPPRLDNRWFRTLLGKWIASVAVDYQHGQDPPANLLVPDPHGSLGTPNLAVPAGLATMVAWETSPTYAAAADYGALAAAGFKTVLIRAANGDGTGANDATLFEPNWRERAPVAKTAGLLPIPWTYWYGPSEGVNGDVAAYLLRCADHTAGLDVGDAPAWIVDAEDRDLPGLAAALSRLSVKTGKPVMLNLPGDPQTYGLRWNWAELAKACAGWMPMLYTAQWGATPTIEAALAELATVGSAPLYPVLDEIDPIRIQQQVTKLRARGFQGVSWWCVSNAPGCSTDYVNAWLPPAAPTGDGQDKVALANAMKLLTEATEAFRQLHPS